MSTAFDMVTQLETLTLGTSGTDLFTNILPESPAGAAAIFDTTSEPPLTAHGGSQTNQRRLVQIQVRDTPENVAAAHARCQTLLDALGTTINLTVNGRTYEMIRLMKSTALLSRDQNANPIFYGELEATIDLG